MGPPFSRSGCAGRGGARGERQGRTRRSRISFAPPRVRGQVLPRNVRPAHSAPIRALRALVDGIGGYERRHRLRRPLVRGGNRACRPTPSTRCCSACNCDPQYHAISIAYRADRRATHAPNNNACARRPIHSPLFGGLHEDQTYLDTHSSLIRLGFEKIGRSIRSIPSVRQSRRIRASSQSLCDSKNSVWRTCWTNRPRNASHEAG